MFPIILSSALTRLKKRVLLQTLSLEVAKLCYCFIPLSLPSKDLTFSRTNESELSHYAFSGSTRSQRNKSSLQCTKSSCNTHFWMTHLNRREVVMHFDKRSAIQYALKIM